jgi:hypothetical protein
LLSDLYPRWLGARELLLHHRDPYSPEVTREIQTGYYGRPLDPESSGDTKDQAAFAYPVFVMFFLAPTVKLPFQVVRSAFNGILIGLTILSVPLWLSAAKLRVRIPDAVAITIHVLGIFQFPQGLKIKQLTLLVAPLLAIALTLLIRGQLLTAGGFLAMALIKPQLSLPLAAWLLVWTTGDFKRRWQFAAGFLGVMVLLLAGSQVILPGWIAKFYRAVLEYRQYTGGESLAATFLGKTMGTLVDISLVAVCTAIGWRLRRADAGSQELATMMALVLAVTVVIVPMVALYNQVLLMLPLFVVWRSREKLWKGTSASRVLLLLTIAWGAWPWLAAALLMLAAAFVPLTGLFNNWSLPLSTMLGFPLLVTILILLKWRALSSAPMSTPEV